MKTEQVILLIVLLTFFNTACATISSIDDAVDLTEEKVTTIIEVGNNRLIFKNLSPKNIKSVVHRSNGEFEIYLKKSNMVFVVFNGKFDDQKNQMTYSEYLNHINYYLKTSKGESLKQSKASPLSYGYHSAFKKYVRFDSQLKESDTHGVKYGPLYIWFFEGYVYSMMVGCRDKCSDRFFNNFTMQ